MKKDPKTPNKTDLTHVKKIHSDFIENQIAKYGKGKKKKFKVKMTKKLVK